VEEKAKFDGIFESLLPVNGLLSGDKVKPVLMNSKLPLDVLGRVRYWAGCFPILHCSMLDC
jgi:epidermal growth factor receptor substrate 15